MFRNVKKLSTKLLIVFLLVAVISSVSGVIGALVLKSSDTEYSNALVNHGFSQGNMGKLGMAINENRAMIRDIIFRTDKKSMDSAYQTMQGNVQEINDLIEKIRPTNLSQQAKAQFALIEDSLADYRVEQAKVVDFGMSNDQKSAAALWDEVAMPLATKLSEAVEEMVRLKVDIGNNISTTLTNTSNISMLVIIAVIVAGILISVFIAIFMAKSISKPVIVVQDAARKLSEGHLDFDISSDMADEVGQMTNSFAQAAKMLRENIIDMNRALSQAADGDFNVELSANYIGEFTKIEDSINHIVDSLSSALGQINQASVQVSAGSEQVSAGAQALSQGATEQASSLEELSATISEISSHISETAGNATQAKEETNATGVAVEKSNQRMKEMIDAMGKISDRSSEIGKIVKSIEDIAFQTNILALNAAVEAARAGVAGKGFAVVADEVRSLSRKSTDAAKNTTVLIGETIQAVENGTRIAADTATAMLGVVEGAQKVTVLISAIADASADQANAVSQITVGIDQISSVVQTNSATAEESAAASEELSGQAQMMKTLVGNFKLRNASSNLNAMDVAYNNSISNQYSSHSNMGHGNKY